VLRGEQEKKACRKKKRCASLPRSFVLNGLKRGEAARKKRELIEGEKTYDCRGKSSHQKGKKKFLIARALEGGSLNMGGERGAGGPEKRLEKKRQKVTSNRFPTDANKLKEPPEGHREDR